MVVSLPNWKPNCGISPMKVRANWYWTKRRLIQVLPVRFSVHVTVTLQLLQGNFHLRNKRIFDGIYLLLFLPINWNSVNRLFQNKRKQRRDSYTLDELRANNVPSQENQLYYWVNWTNQFKASRKCVYCFLMVFNHK